MIDRFILTNERVRANAITALIAAPDGHIVTISEPSRTKVQNALLHAWYGEIARQRGGCTMIDVKGEMHQKYGVPIRMRDPQFAWVWTRTGAKLTYEQQCKYLASGVVAVSSAMSVKELSEYMDAMQLDMRAQGYRLTDPDDLKWRGQ